MSSKDESPAQQVAAGQRELYTHGHAAATLRQHGQRPVEEAAAFLLPRLRAGMTVLDVGCGPGSITRGFAERLSTGTVVGVDLSAEALAGAQHDASERGLNDGQATRAELEMAAALRRWAVHPDAFWTFTQVAALAHEAQG